VVWYATRGLSKPSEDLQDSVNLQIEHFPLPADPSMPPPLSTVVEFGISLKYWLNLDKAENAALIVLPDASADSPMLVLSSLLALEICGDVCSVRTTWLIMGSPLRGMSAFLSRPKCWAKIYPVKTVKPLTQTLVGAS
jgi:hypothetical protein